jgi:hypothetical protein
MNLNFLKKYKILNNFLDSRKKIDSPSSFFFVLFFEKEFILAGNGFEPTTFGL